MQIDSISYAFALTCTFKCTYHCKWCICLSVLQMVLCKEAVLLLLSMLQQIWPKQGTVLFCWSGNGNFKLNWHRKILWLQVNREKRDKLFDISVFREEKSGPIDLWGSVIDVGQVWKLFTGWQSGIFRTCCFFEIQSKNKLTSEQQLSYIN